MPEGKPRPSTLCLPPHSGVCRFSFLGLKTVWLYVILLHMKTTDINTGYFANGGDIFTAVGHTGYFISGECILRGSQDTGYYVNGGTIYRRPNIALHLS